MFTPKYQWLLFCKYLKSSPTVYCCSVSIDVPGPVVDLKTVTITKKNITLTWSDPHDNGGSDIIGYEVLRKDAKMKLFRQPMETASCKCDIQGLLAGEEYDFRVIARNKYGDGAPADLGPILAQDPKGKPQQSIKFKHKSAFVTKTLLKLCETNY